MLSSSVSTRLEYQHKTLLELIEGLNDEEIRRNIIPGKWSVFENLVHLATYQHTFLRRLEQVLTEGNPSFSRYTAESDPLFLDNCSRSTREIMQDLVSMRKMLAAKILALRQEQLARKAIHPAYGEMSVVQWTEFFLLHEAHHLFTIFKLAAELKK